MALNPLLPNWQDDIRLATFQKPRTSAGGYAMASVDKGALDAEGRPVNAPEPTWTPSDITGAVPSIGSKTAEAPNALDIANAKSEVDNCLRVVAYQFQVALMAFVNQVTMTKLEDAFQENLKKLLEANTKHVAQMYEGIIELRVRETVEQRAEQMSELAIATERSKHRQAMAELRASSDSVVAREKNAIREQYVGFRERMKREALESVREELESVSESISDMLFELGEG